MRIWDAWIWKDGAILSRSPRRGASMPAELVGLDDAPVDDGVV